MGIFHTVLVLLFFTLLSHCHDNRLKVFVVPHTHLDVGWVWPMDEVYEYYVREIYTSVVNELLKPECKECKFIGVEMYWFRRWWEEIREGVRKKVSKLVSEKRVEFVIGGWVMNDEAVTSYTAIIDQYTEGHQFIMYNFGVKPQFGWQIDPFGASAVLPTLQAMMGFNAHLISRIDYQLAEKMAATKQLQFVWQGSKSLREEVIFTHTMDSYSYCVPGNIDFDERGGFYWDGFAVIPYPKDHVFPSESAPVNSSNLPLYAKFMIDNINQRANYFPTNNLLWPWGCDKQHFNASVQFSNMNKIIRYLQNSEYNSTYDVQYATLFDYFKSVHDSEHEWDKREAEDFFPYGSSNISYWTGFYSSRNRFKGLERKAESLLRMAEVLGFMAKLFTLNETIKFNQILQPYNSNITNYRRAVAEIQHHDAITGTETNEVLGEYEQTLNETERKVNGTIEYFASLLTKSSNLSLNSSSSFSSLSINQFLPVVVFNSLGWSLSSFVSFSLPPLPSYSLVVYDSSMNVVNSQVFVGDKDNTLFFHARDVPPVGFKTYFVQMKDSGSSGYITPKLKYTHQVQSIENSNYKLEFDVEKGILLSITNKNISKQLELTHKYFEYHSFVKNGTQSSDNYVFRPTGPPTVVSDTANIVIEDGPYVSQVSQQFSNGHKQIYRIYKGGQNTEDFIHIIHSVGPLLPNRECITRYDTNLKTNKILYSDNNGFQIQKREFRENVSLPIPANYYPMVYSGSIEDETQGVGVTLISERSHGVSSQADGSIEVMLHRRVMTDDSGYHITLNDTDTVYPSFYLLFSSPLLITQMRAKKALELNFGLKSLFGTSSLTLQEVKFWIANYITLDSYLKHELPVNIHLLSLKQQNITDVYENNQWDTAEKTLLRLQHLFEVDESPKLSKPVTLNLQQLFAKHKIASLQQKTLTCLSNITENHKRWKWPTKQDNQNTYQPHQHTYTKDSLVNTTITPKNINTFTILF